MSVDRLIPQGKKPKDKLLYELFDGAKKRWNKCMTLIVDEISMMSDDLFDKLDYIARCGGGGQLVRACQRLCLPPVLTGVSSRRNGSGFLMQSRSQAARLAVRWHSAGPDRRLFATAARVAGR